MSRGNTKYAEYRSPRMPHVSCATINTACDRFLRSRGEDVGGGMRGVIRESLLRKKNDQHRRDHADEIARELEGEC